MSDTTTFPATTAAVLNSLSSAVQDMNRASRRVEGEAKDVREALDLGTRPSAHAQTYTDLLAAITKVNTLMDVAGAALHGFPDQRAILKRVLDGEDYFMVAEKPSVAGE